jgi:hypothetical protein
VYNLKGRLALSDNRPHISTIEPKPEDMVGLHAARTDDLNVDWSTICVSSSQLMNRPKWVRLSVSRERDYGRPKCEQNPEGDNFDK